MDADSLPAPVARVLEATNRGDLDDFVAQFGSDGVVDDWGRRFAGPDEIRGWSRRESIGKQQTFTVTGVDRDDTGVTVRVQVGGNGYTGPSTFNFRYDGDLVTEMRIRE